MHHPFVLSLAILAFLAPVALAQAPAGAAPEAAPPPATGGVEEVGAGLELEPARDGYAYNPQGRRDPFISLLKPVAGGEGGKGKPQGIAGFLIQEVALKGIVKDSIQGYIALLLGPENKTYFCKVGQRLYDGAIIAIDAATEKFRQEVTDPLAPVKVREVIKTLYPSEEARQ
jgi:type IV pilus assembly protein PilP